MYLEAKHKLQKVKLHYKILSCEFKRLIQELNLREIARRENEKTTPNQRMILKITGYSGLYSGARLMSAC